MNSLLPSLNPKQGECLSRWDTGFPHAHTEGRSGGWDHLKVLLARLPTGCVALDSSLNLSELQFS